MCTTPSSAWRPTSRLRRPLEELGRGKSAPVSDEDFAAALRTDESRRTFWLVEDDDELQKMLDEPLEFWRIFLHPSSVGSLSRHGAAPVLVRGRGRHG